MLQARSPIGSPARLRRQRGGVLIYVTILMVAIVAFTALAIDGSRSVAALHELQAAADSAALAAALNLQADEDPNYLPTRQIAVDLAGAHTVGGLRLNLDLNTANKAGGDVVIGVWNAQDRSFRPDLSLPNAVQVNARRTTDSSDGGLPFIFGGFFGATEGNFASSAVARFDVDSPYIIVLDTTAEPAMEIGGTAGLFVDGGAVHVNSNAPCAGEVKGTGGLSTPELSLVGGACTTADGVTGSIEEGADLKDDPYAHLLPTTAEWDALRKDMKMPKGAKGKISSSGTYTPGYYPEGLRMSGGEAILEPGEYMFGGSGIRMTGGTLRGDEVTLFLDLGARMDIGGNANVYLSPALTGDFVGMTIFTHRETDDDDAIDLGGGGDIDIKGIVYSASGGIAMAGNAGSKQIGGLVVSVLDFTGTADYVITGDMIPPTDDPTSRLVD